MRRCGYQIRYQCRLSVLSLSRDPKVSAHAEWFVVLSGESSRIDVILDDGTGPLETWREYARVKARTAQRAKVLMVRACRRRFGSMARRRAPWLTDGNPFRGMQAIRESSMEIESASLGASSVEKGEE